MNEDIRNDVNLVLQQVYENPPGQQKQEPDEDEEVIQVHHYPNAIVIIKEPGKSTSTNIPIVDSTPKDAQESQALQVVPYLTVGIFIFLILSSILFQLYILFNPPIATLTIFPISKPITLTGTLQLGRILNPITLSQSQTVPTTGKGHQDAHNATGELIFYNGQSTEQTIAVGTIFTGADGIQVATDQTAIIPPASPPQFGEVAVSAHAVSTGSAGNIAAGDINTTIAIAIFAKNIAAFHGGADERNFQTVAKTDIDTTAATLKPTLAQSMQGAITGQLKNGEQFTALPCSPTVTSDHQPGAEATQVKVMVSETCSAVAYNGAALQSKATDLLDHQAAKKLGSGYSILGYPQITVTQATSNHTSPPLVFIIFHAQGTWIYALSEKAQEHIKSLIVGKTKQEALRILESQPGINQAVIAWGDDTKLPKSSRYIHISLFIM